jgi:hypothetical protein
MDISMPKSVIAKEERRQMITACTTEKEGANQSSESFVAEIMRKVLPGTFKKHKVAPSH